MAFIAALVVSLSSLPAGASLPPLIQAALIAKVLQFDEVLAEKGMDAARLVLVAADDWKDTLVLVQKELQPAGIATKILTPGELANQKDVSVVYVSAAAAPLVADYCLAQKVLSIGNDLSLAERGVVAIAVGKSSKGRPEIVISKGRLAREGHRLADKLMTLARVVD